MTDESEIDAASVFLPIPVTRRLGTVATTDLFRCFRFLFHRRLIGLLCFGSGVGNGRGFAYHVVLATHKILVLPLLPDNLPAAASSFSALPDHALVVLEGPDAVAFAQAQFANDVVALMPGNWQWNAWLTPKGRVIAVFALLRTSEDRLLLVVPDMAADAFVPQLQRFVFRRKLQISAATELQVGGSFQKPVSAETARIGLVGEAIELDYGDEEQPRTLLISADGEQPDDAQARARWFAHDLKAGLPRLPDAQREQWTPQQLSLERLHAFSVKKGCYPGQEIVARTHFLGKAKRGLALFHAETALLTGTDIDHAGHVLGRIVSATAAEPFLALAVLPQERVTAGLMAAGAAIRETSLIGGLQR